MTDRQIAAKIREHFQQPDLKCPNKSV